MNQHSSANTRDQIGHFFANVVTTYVVLRREGLADQELATSHKKEFIAGMEATIQKLGDGRVSEYGGIGEEQLTEMLDAAKNSNWENPEDLKNLHHVYGRIIGQEFSEPFIAGIK